MKALKMSLYAVLGVMVGAIFVACAEADFVDDYSDATFYDDEHSNEYAAVDEGDEYVDEEIIEEIIGVYDDADKSAKNLAQKLDSAPKTAQKQDSEAQDDEIIIIDDNTFEYQGMVFKHNLGKDADLNAILDSFEGKSIETQTDEIVVESKKSNVPKAAESSVKPKSAQIAQKPTPSVAKSSVKTPSTGAIKGAGLSGINQSIAKLKAQCDSKGDLQKCEALARIYAIQEKLDLSVQYYDKACDNGEGSVRACFFLSRIYENDGNGAVVEYYMALLGGRTAKIGNTELNLSTGKVDSAKRALKMSCTEGNEGSCNVLQSVFKVRNEKREMQTYFGMECWRRSALGCEILRSM